MASTAAADTLSRDQAAIRAELDELETAKRRVGKAASDAQAQLDVAVAELEGLDADESAVVLGERDAAEHRAARRRAEEDREEAVRARSAAESAATGLDERQSALEEELRLCLEEIESKGADLDVSVEARNDAASEFGRVLDDLLPAFLQLEAARGEVDELTAEIKRLGGHDRLLGLAGEPWTVASEDAAVAARLAGVVRDGPVPATETAAERDARLEAKREHEEQEAAARRESRINECVRSRRSLEMCPADIRDEVARRYAELAAARAAAEPAERELDLTGSGLTLGPGDRASASSKAARS